MMFEKVILFLRIISRSGSKCCTGGTLLLKLFNKKKMFGTKKNLKHGKTTHFRLLKTEKFGFWYEY